MLAFVRSERMESVKLKIKYNIRCSIRYQHTQTQQFTIVVSIVASVSVWMVSNKFVAFHFYRDNA